MIAYAYTFRCDVRGCDEMTVATTPVAYSYEWSEREQPRLPKGWHAVDGALVCPRHLLDVDGARLEEVLPELS